MDIGFYTICRITRGGPEDRKIIEIYKGYYKPLINGRYACEIPFLVEQTIPKCYHTNEDIDLASEVMNNLFVLKEVMEEQGWTTEMEQLHLSASYSFDEYCELLICTKHKLKRISREDKIRKAEEFILSKGYILEMCDPPYEDDPMVDRGCTNKNCFYDDWTIYYGVDDRGKRQFEVCINLFEPETSSWHCTYCREIESDRMSEMTIQCLCGYESPYGARFCCGCGKPIIIKSPICQCGTMFKEGANFCHMCGKDREL